jgi:DNA-binding XRE family transcriptional regulator
MNYSKELLWYRAKHDLTQKQLGDILKVSRETVGFIERGQQTRLSSKLKAKIEMLIESEGKGNGHCLH